VSDGALLTIRRDDHDVAQSPHGLHKRKDARRIDAVIIGDEDAVLHDQRVRSR
jgi:hypothetical protein